MGKVIDSVYEGIPLAEVLLGRPIRSSTFKKLFSASHGLFARYGQSTPLFDGPAWIRDDGAYGSAPTTEAAKDLATYCRQARFHRAVGSTRTLVIAHAKIYADNIDFKIDLVRHELDDGGVIAPATVATLNPIEPAGTVAWVEDTVAFLLTDSTSPSGIPYLYGPRMVGKRVSALEPAILYQGHLLSMWIDASDLPL